jgi:uncharacterized protein YegL
MSGKKIGALNEVINNVIAEIQSRSAEIADVKIKIAALKFSDEAEWLYPTPIDVELFKWEYLDTGGGSNLGEAFCFLNDRLNSVQGFLDKTECSFAEYVGDATVQIARLKCSTWSGVFGQSASKRNTEINLR